MSLHIFGVRHHGPGSARSLVQALEELQPDIILVEGPPDADNMIEWLGTADMEPPVALLVYNPNDTALAAFYPFAVFSPEYQALRFAVERGIPARFCDLPQSIQLAVLADERDKAQAAAEEAANNPPQPTPTIEPTDETSAPDQGDAPHDEPPPEKRFRMDPLGVLAEAAGYEDGERWWDHMVEQRRDGTGLFDAVLEALSAAREKIGEPEDERELAREAYMRRVIREALAKHRCVAVVCGAWHAPAIQRLEAPDADDALLATMPQPIATTATWVPWTHKRLSAWTGYGAGVRAPGWYHFLWTTEADEMAVGWLTRVATLLRDEKLDASTAQIIDAVRLADALAAIRGRPNPGLEEFNEAALSLFCYGNPTPMHLIAERLAIGDELGAVPDGVPMVPLQRNFKHEMDRLRLRLAADASMLTLDLRVDRHLQRSQLLHRLHILNVPWATKEDVGEVDGTFREVWKLDWQPEYEVRLIEKSAHGSTIEAAATDFALQQAKEAESIPQLTHLVGLLTLADLPDALPTATAELGNRVGVSTDIIALMNSLPPLAQVRVYGDVRDTDVAVVVPIIDSIVARTCVGLPSACASLDNDAARTMFAAMITFHGAIGLLREHQTAWHRAITGIMNQDGAHGLVRGRATRLLVEAGVLDTDETARQMRLALSRAGTPEDAAAWLTGFLEGNGLILLHHAGLLPTIDRWVQTLSATDFEALLPLMRRTFASFTAAEVRKIGAVVSQFRFDTVLAATDDDFEDVPLLPSIANLLGLQPGPAAQDETDDIHDDEEETDDVD